MTTHVYHEDVATHGLADDCERCAEHAERPAESLDDTNFRILVERIERDLPSRSLTERIAMMNLRRAMAACSRLRQLDR